MTIRIVMGTALSGKTYFIKDHFSGSEILSIGEYQKQVIDESGAEDYVPIDEYRELLQKANDQIKRDMVERLQQNKDVVMEHTLYKAERRKEYIDAFRKVTDAPIDIYLMQPSEEQLLLNIQGEEKNKGMGIEWIKSEMRLIEVPTAAEGFAHVYIVNDRGIQDWIQMPRQRKVIDKNTNITLNTITPEINKQEHKISGFGDKPFKHICECCGTVEILTSKKSFELGWDYPGEGGIYSSVPNYMFGILSPRKCGKCAMKDTAYWAIAVEGKTTAELSENQLQAVERIMQEPEILRVDE